MYIRLAAVCALFGLSLFLTPAAYKTFIDLNRGNWQVLMHKDHVPAVHEFVEPRGGEGVLPLPVQLMIRLLRVHQISSFRYSSLVANNEEIKQRLVEGAYPIRFSNDAHYLIFIKTEPLSASCRTIAAEGEVALAHCP